MYIYLEHILCSIIVFEHHQSLHQTRDAVLRKFLVDKRKGQSLEILQRQVCTVNSDFILYQTDLEAEADLLAALLSHDVVWCCLA